LIGKGLIKIWVRIGGGLIYNKGSPSCIDYKIKQLFRKFTHKNKNKTLTHRRGAFVKVQLPLYFFRNSEIPCEVFNFILS